MIKGSNFSDMEVGGSGKEVSSVWIRVHVFVLLLAIMFFPHKDIIFPVGKMFLADSHQIVLFHYQTVSAQCLSREEKGRI